MRVPLARYPGMNRFVLDWLGGDERFLRRSAPSETAERPAPVSGRTALAEALDRSNRKWGIFAKDALRNWATGEALTVVAGQQVGFAGGPLYTLAKVATLVRLKRDLERQGIPVTAFFWLATEDHDYEEVATLNVPVAMLSRQKEVNRQIDLLSIRGVRASDSRAMVGALPVPQQLVDQLLSLHDMERPEWLRPGITFRDSFAELIAAVFGSEIVLVDALLPELRRAGAPLFQKIHDERAAIQDLLTARAKELEAAGYSEQIVAADSGQYTLLFEMDGHGNRKPSCDAIEPEKTSTSALTRPLLQDSVLRPDIFVGGPAEVAYYAQIAPLHKRLGVPMPRVALRGHVLVAPKRIVRAIERYGLDPAAIFTSADAIVAAREPAEVARIRAISERGRQELMQRVAEIGELALPADHAVARSIQRSVGHLEYHFDKLSERAIRALVRKDATRHRAAGQVVSTLYPDRQVQDRVVSWFSYWCAYGRHLVERIVEEVEPDSDSFRIVSL